MIDIDKDSVENNAIVSGLRITLGTYCTSVIELQRLAVLALLSTRASARLITPSVLLSKSASASSASSASSATAWPSSASSDAWQSCALQGRPQCALLSTGDMRTTCAEGSIFTR